MNEQRITVQDNYVVTEKTIALVPAAHIDYQTVAFERNSIIYVKQRPLQIIEKACLQGGATYAGRRQAAIHATSLKKKVPIAINTHKNIYAFPTQSPSQFDCSWIFYSHILSFTPIPKIPNKCTLTFKNTKQLTLAVSPKVIEKQMHRTAFIILLFSQHLIDFAKAENDIRQQG
ncbi:competence protein ComK [Evansella cellulosilytica]|uniref:ComK family protein n=1 Tax=Evansella cellulosilytica (strain ATCC 21833 / DSM 2522 / FERM P-1141 / JCM 9156 / N-4) TaxID=649639 RepID=E6TVK5_EVAC2|nr:competence protein ComK [Evansella cellulosilytica]ADU32133.1 ComK family protein [Evansella cellulosilytica DSM 2522]